MAIDSLTSAKTSTDTSSSNTVAAKGTTAMDKEAFLKLLVAQLSNQDPLKPMEGTEFVSQLSQFSMVEQSMASNTKLDTVAAQLSGLNNSQAASLVGRSVSIKGGTMTYPGYGAASAATSLSGAASNVTATIRDASGNAVRTIEVGAKPAGSLSVTWDGKNDDGIAAPAGKYSLDVKATAADGSAVKANANVSGSVKEVTYENGYAEVILDSGARAPLSNLVSVDRGATPSP